MTGSSLPVQAAATYDLSNGDITITATGGTYNVVHSGGTEVTGVTGPITVIQSDNDTATQNVIKVVAEAGQTAQVILAGVNINASGRELRRVTGTDRRIGYAALGTRGAGNVSITLEGENKLKSGSARAGLQKDNQGTLTITGRNNTTDKLIAVGYGGAGIGGGDCGDAEGENTPKDVSHITITGGHIEADGYDSSCAGIGAATTAGASHITITGNAYVKAIGGRSDGAGIGGGKDASHITITGNAYVEAGTDNPGEPYGPGIGSTNHISHITISGNARVKAKGGENSAGIGRGVGVEGVNTSFSGTAEDITITDNAYVEATGGNFGAGIGGGLVGSAKNITISGGRVIATGGTGGAGIGGGASKTTYQGDMVTTTLENLVISGHAKVTVTGGKTYVSASNHEFQTPVAIGGGADCHNYHTTYDALNPVIPDTSGLYTTGWVETKQLDRNGAEISGSAQKTDGTVIPPVDSASADDARPQRSVFQRTLDGYSHSIASAEPGATITIQGDESFNALPNSLMQELVKKKDVSLKFSYAYQGKQYTIMIPAGKAEDNHIPWYGPIYLWKNYGSKAN